MTIATLIIDVAANTAALQRDTAQISRTLESTTGVVKNFAAGLASAFTVGALTAFARDLSSFAGQMQDLSTETGVGVEQLQALNYVAAGVGLTVEDVTGAVTQLSRRLAGGDDSAEAAVARLGLQVDRLLAQSPDQALIDIAQAVATIENPMERTRTSMDLFGRSGSRMLRLMTDDIGGLIEAAHQSGAVIDQELIAKADEFDDRWSQALIKFKAMALSTFDAVTTHNTSSIAEWWFGGLEKSAQRATETALGNAKGFPIGAALGAVSGRTPLEMANDDLGESKMRKAAKAAEDLTKFQKELIANTHALNAITEDAGEAVFQEPVEALGQYFERLGFVQQEIIELNGLTVDPLFQEPIAELDRYFKRLQDLPSALSMVATTIPDLLKRSFTGGGGMGGFLKALTSEAGGALSMDLFSAGGPLNGLANSMTKGVSNLFGKAVGDAFGMAIPGIGSLIGPAVQGLGKLFGKMFGGGEHAKVNDMRDQYIGAAGGLEKLAAAAQRAGVSVDSLLSVKKVKDFESAVAALSGALDEQTMLEERLAAAMERHGIEFDKLGFQARNRDLARSAENLLLDYAALTRAGFMPADEAIQAMQSSLLEFVHTSMATTTQIPEQMRPMLQRMVDLGLLTDLSGEKLVDLGQLNFADTLVSKFDLLIEKLNTFLDRLGDVPSSINVDVPDAPIGPGNGPVPFDTDTLGFAGGTGGHYRDFGAGTRVTLHNRERVMTEAEGRRESAMAREMKALKDAFLQSADANRRLLQQLPITFANARLTQVS